MSNQKLRDEIREFLRTNFIFDDNVKLEDGQSLLGSGVIDSTGILELISWMEESHGLAFKDSDLVADNFDSVDKIVAFLNSKR